MLTTTYGDSLMRTRSGVGGISGVPPVGPATALPPAVGCRCPLLPTPEWPPDHASNMDDGDMATFVTLAQQRRCQETYAALRWRCADRRRRDPHHRDALGRRPLRRPVRKQPREGCSRSAPVRIGFQATSVPDFPHGTTSAAWGWAPSSRKPPDELCTRLDHGQADHPRVVAKEERRNRPLGQPQVATRARNS